MIDAVFAAKDDANVETGEYKVEDVAQEVGDTVELLNALEYVIDDNIEVHEVDDIGDEVELDVEAEYEEVTTGADTSTVTVFAAADAVVVIRTVWTVSVPSIVSVEKM